MLKQSKAAAVQPMLVMGVIVVVVAVVLAVSIVVVVMVVVVVVMVETITKVGMAILMERLFFHGCLAVLLTRLRILLMNKYSPF